MPALQRAFSCADRDGQEKAPAENREGQTKSVKEPSRRYAPDHGSATPSRQSLFFTIGGTFTAALAAGPDRHLVTTRRPDGLAAGRLAVACALSQEESASASC